MVHATAALSALALLAASGSVPAVHGHGFLISPRSRNIYAHEEGPGWIPKTDPAATTKPVPEYCPHCLNRQGVCGGATMTGPNYGDPKNILGDSLGFVEQAEYTAGENIDLEIVLTAHHRGHFEFSLCPLADGQVAPTEACFDENEQLEFVSDNLYGGNKDDNYKERAYLAPSGVANRQEGGSPRGMLFKYTFKLPEGVHGDRVALQWHYVSGNSCQDEGYVDYSFPTAWAEPGANLATCSRPLLTDGSVPEQFWNCADIKILPAGPVPPTTQEPPAPTPAVVGNLNYCGMDWSDANGKCATACPIGQDSECPGMEKCFANCDACAGPVVPTEPTTFAPVPAPVPTAPTPVVTTQEDSRMVAFLGNWQACPTAAQLAQYTHILISFAVTYTWKPNPTPNACDQTCNIGSSVPICANENGGEVDEWRAAGKKVILSFGGAGMGGSWDSSVDYCWEYCFGKEEEVVTQLSDIVEAQNFDGVDIDYEYYYEDADNGRFTTEVNAAAARKFLQDVTVGLKQKLPVGQNMVTHAPMEPDMVAGTSYYNILKNNAASVDFVMPQYYNGYINPATNGLTGGSPDALSHFNNLVNNVFGGDATRVVFGFCIDDCGAFDITAQAAKTLMTDLSNQHSCAGGAFFWAVEYDEGGAWSSAVNEAVQPSAGCSAGTAPTPATLAPATMAPATQAPATGAPVTTAPATQAPATESPVTASPATQAPATTAPVATSPATQAPAMTSPVTQAPATASPATQAPATASPATQAPATASPATQAPATASPATEAPATASPATQAPVTAAPATPAPVSSGPVTYTATTTSRCGSSEMDARGHCRPTCVHQGNCAWGQWCWGVHANYCDDPNFTPPTYTNPLAVLGQYRCGKTEVEARELCKKSCTHSIHCDAGEACHGVQGNYCDSDSTERRGLRG